MARRVTVCNNVYKKWVFFFPLPSMAESLLIFRVKITGGELCAHNVYDLCACACCIRPCVAGAEGNPQSLDRCVTGSLRRRRRAAGVRTLNVTRRDRAHVLTRTLIAPRGTSRRNTRLAERAYDASARTPHHRQGPRSSRRTTARE